MDPLSESETSLLRQIVFLFDDFWSKMLQQPPHLAQFSPLHVGRSFICYRDVNKAIEKHREIYGLRLVLKKATKLENYCLTVDQMRDLNFRLKYGELDYQCSVDNGRPGRPGNE